MQILIPKQWGESSEGKDWDRCCATFEIAAFRTGWKGAWDAIKAAWKKDFRIQVLQDITISLYIKEELNEFGRVESEYVWGGQIEHAGEKD